MNKEIMSLLGNKLLTDIDIIKLAQQGMIYPFVDKPTKFKDNAKLISYGLSSFGYDVRIGNKLLILKNDSPMMIDPKNPNPDDYEVVTPDEQGRLIIPPYSFAMGESFEKFNIPTDVFALVFTKSTYARSAVHTEITPLEPGWRGSITLEISNPTGRPIAIYALEGLCQVIFFSSEDPPNINYENKNGKYQDQSGIVLPRI